MALPPPVRPSAARRSPIALALLAALVPALLSGCGGGEPGSRPATTGATAVATTAQRWPAPTPLPYDAALDGGSTRVQVTTRRLRGRQCLRGALVDPAAGGVAAYACPDLRVRPPAGSRARGRDAARTLVGSAAIRCPGDQLMAVGWVRAPVRFLQLRTVGGEVVRATPLKVPGLRGATGFALALRVTESAAAWEGLDARGAVVRSTVYSRAAQRSMVAICDGPRGRGFGSLPDLPAP